MASDDNTTHSQLMRLSYEATIACKKNNILAPARLVHHVPHFGTVLRTLDTVRVSHLREGMEKQGFRGNEPIIITPPILKLGFPRFVLSGNHRLAAFRNCGMVLIPAFVVEEKSITELMRILEKKIEKQPGTDDGTEARRNDIFLRCLSLLILAAQFREPSPKPATTLQMVCMIRTFVTNDPDVAPYSRKKGPYGGLEVVRKMLFDGGPLHSDGIVHFLLDTTKGKRHMNKLLKGTYQLIETRLTQSHHSLKKCDTLLDLLLLWEECGLMPIFGTGHLTNIGGMSSERAKEIAEQAMREIDRKMINLDADPSLQLAPYRMPRKRLTGVSERAHDIDIVTDVDKDQSPMIMDVDVEEGEDSETSNEVEGEDKDGDVKADDVTDEIKINDDIVAQDDHDTEPRRSGRKRKKVETYSEPTLQPSRRKTIQRVAKSTTSGTGAARIILLEQQLKKREEEVDGLIRNAVEKAKMEEKKRITQEMKNLEEERKRDQEQFDVRIQEAVEEAKMEEKKRITQKMKLAEDETHEEQVVGDERSGNKTQEVEIKRLREQLDTLQKSTAESSQLNTEMETLRMQNEQLQTMLREALGGESNRERGRGKRTVVVPSSKLREYSIEQLENLVVRARNMISIKQ